MYLVFGFDYYYPGGGVNDLRATFYSLNDAIDFAKYLVSKKDTWEEDTFDVAQVYSTKEEKMIAEFFREES